MARVVRNFGCCLCLCLACLSDVWASADVCEEPNNYSHLSVGLSSLGDSAIDQPTATIGLENRNVDLQFKTSGDKLLFGIGPETTTAVFVSASHLHGHCLLMSETSSTITKTMLSSYWQL
jgi:hypothetical protein